MKGSPRAHHLRGGWGRGGSSVSMGCVQKACERVGCVTVPEQACEHDAHASARGSTDEEPPWNKKTLTSVSVGSGGSSGGGGLETAHEEGEDFLEMNCKKYKHGLVRFQGARTSCDKLIETTTDDCGHDRLNVGADGFACAMHKYFQIGLGLTQ